MKTLRIIIPSLLFALTSCLTSKYPTGTSDFWGVPMTCIVDSTFLTSDTLVKLKRATPTNQGPHPKNPSFKFENCDNRPAYIDALYFWPSQIILNLKKNTYLFLHSSGPDDPAIKYGDDKFKITFRHDMGTITFQKDKCLLTLKSNLYNWSRTYNVSYSKADDVLTLRPKKIAN